MCPSKHINKKKKRHIYLINNMYSEHRTLTTLKTQTTQFLKREKHVDRHWTGEDTQTAASTREDALPRHLRAAS